ncbi:MAG: hypothetical protein HY722_13720 [Planctomycetes bacterium]|nr:hypothetical protein [Planctomycetota bacterium]
MPGEEIIEKPPATPFATGILGLSLVMLLGAIALVWAQLGLYLRADDKAHIDAGGEETVAQAWYDKFEREVHKKEVPAGD